MGIPCEQYLNAINEKVDGTLGPLRAAELELHLESCDDCARLVADLREIARAAQSLDDLQPSARVWTQIANQLRQEDRVAATKRAMFARPSYTVLGLAAALVLAIGASLMLLIPRERPTPAAVEQTAATPSPGPAGNPADAEAVQGLAPGVASEWAMTEKHFQNMIEEAKKPGSTVTPETVKVLQQNYLIMTDAMEKSSKVLVSDPENTVVRESFYDLLRQKIRFLQDTIALMNEMRQGDAAGAAEIVESGKS